MNRIKFLALTFTFLFTAQVSFSQGYFEGEITVTQTSKSETSDIKVYLSPARIKIEGGSKKVDVKMLGTDDVSSVLIRLDNEDFVMFSSDLGNSALKVSKLDIENMMNMVKNMAKNFGGENAEVKKDTPEVTIKRTKETKSIAGYSTTKLIVKSQENPNEETHVWITKDLNVNLGMLTNGWEFLDTFSSGSATWLRQGEFPMSVQSYNNGSVISEIQVSKVKKGKVNPDFLSVPDGVQLMSLQDMIMKKMMGN